MEKEITVKKYEDILTAARDGIFTENELANLVHNLKRIHKNVMRDPLVGTKTGDTLLLKGNNSNATAKVKLIKVNQTKCVVELLEDFEDFREGMELNAPFQLLSKMEPSNV